MKSKYINKTETHTKEDAEGNISQTKKETTVKFEDNNEPDYIKLYTRVWTELNEIPVAYREFFLQLALRMHYANSIKPFGGQIVYTTGPNKKDIMELLKWQDRMYRKALTELVKCNALKRIERGIYQINPTYAGKGEWKYNPKRQQGGIEDIIGSFSIKNKTIDTQIIWADDGTNSEFNNQYRQGLGVIANQETVLTHTTMKPTSHDEQESPQEEELQEPSNAFDLILQGQKWNGKIYRGNKIYLNNTEVMLTDEQAELLKTHQSYKAYD